VFANVAAAPQRLFFSKVNDIFRFATHKLFLTENRQYVAINGAIKNGSNVATLSSLSEAVKFTRKLSDYYIESPFFDPETKIESLSALSLTLTREAAVPNQLDIDEKIALDLWKAQADEKENNPLVLVIGQAYPYSIDSYDPTLVTATIKTSSITVKENKQNYAKTVYFDESNVHFEMASAQVFLMQLGAEVLQTLNPLFTMNFATAEQSNNFNQARMALIGNAQFFRYVVRDKAFAGAPDVIYAEIVGYYYYDEAAVSIPFYVKSIIEDRHPTAEDGFTFEIASDMSDAIRWVAQSKSLLVGTETGEWVIPAEATAVNIQAILNSRYGSDSIQATAVGDALCFFQSGKKSLVEYYIPQQDTNFRANNLAMLSRNMLRESPAKDFDFVSAPCAKILVCREDGVVATLLYERGSGTFAWGRVVTAGRILSLATLPGESGFDDVYLVVERNGAHFLERLDEEAPAYLDSHKEWMNDAPQFLAAGNGDFILADDGRNVIIGGYDVSAVVYDETDNISWPIESAPQRDPRRRMWVGYPYASRMRSMPVLANDQMKVNLIKTLSVRFNGSYMPRIKTKPDGPEEHILQSEPFSGIVQVPFPGSYERDAFFELTHDGPTPCRVLAINAEAQ
jgi:hypothetical protein